MSFRIRVFLLVAVVGLGATGLTVALTWWQARDQVGEAASASRETTETIRGELRAQALRNGTWEGVDQTLKRLRAQTGQRIRLVDPYGNAVADTDHMDGRAARPPGPVAVIVDPLPTLVLPDGGDERMATLTAIGVYREETVRSACLFRAGYTPLGMVGADGVPRHGLSGVDPDTLDVCRPGPFPEGTREADRLEVGQCAEAGCLREAFRRRITDSEVAPPTLLLTIGAANEPVRALDTGPVLLITVVVAALAVGGALLISRRVLRPIGTLTAAARRLADGDRAGRVPDDGRDEIGELARAFNQMTDSVRAAEEDQRRLIADVAHELRTPLANLRGYLEAIQDGVIEPTPEVFASLHDEVILNQRIVDDLQELALAEAGALVYHREPTDLAELMETARTAHRPAADAVGVRLTVESDGPVFADADADRIRQIVGNLVGNALRATASGGSVTLRAHARGDRAVLQVTDTGVGIAPEHLPLVFDRLWRADPARGRGTGGSGLGLAIVRQIVHDHGGEVSARSTEGAGTTFEVSLPLTGDRVSGAAPIR
ncbi:two-component system sensor histidine kinase BaeS [Actinoplanes campanulatus]|uniref:histidine kinase n=1 Tax=Actinoplanes campanulatus TaxID=113559 RepID=A0A7W5AFP0_9ACTN|nr:ATP-binding protein [Actinoplanes campanulatus]MBB3095477.1 two-component system sensor histidine kinase BaeS [Actinoplanes campanulatus]GGN09265.1 two-component sensor histidine kinase [Actinoplanes campanulatus]GID36365.1 two-component sensor histidine kinase [Actinoplanes campanulatus]